MHTSTCLITVVVKLLNMTLYFQVKLWCFFCWGGENTRVGVIRLGLIYWYFPTTGGTIGQKDKGALLVGRGKRLDDAGTL